MFQPETQQLSRRREEDDERHCDDDGADDADDVERVLLERVGVDVVVGLGARRAGHNVVGERQKDGGLHWLQRWSNLIVS